MKTRVYYRSSCNDFVAYCNHPTLGRVMGWSGTSAKQAIRDCKEQTRRRALSEGVL
jgi:hypothetical protein